MANREEMAALLNQLIYEGVTDEQGASLPGDWGQVYRTVAKQSGGPAERQAAFQRALSQLEDPASSHRIYWAVVQAAPLESRRSSPMRGRLYSAADAFKAPPPLRWSVQGLFSRPSLNMLVGAGGAKKTYAALDLAVCLAQGAAWLGRKTEACPVLVVDEESGVMRLWSRLHGILKAHASAPEIPLYFISLAGFDLRERSELALLQSKALEVNAGFVIIDALVDVMRGGDENSVQDVQPVMHNLRTLSETCDASVLVLHHTNKGGSMRGSSSIAAAVDLLMMVKMRTSNWNLRRSRPATSSRPASRPGPPSSRTVSGSVEPRPGA